MTTASTTMAERGSRMGSMVVSPSGCEAGTAETPVMLGSVQAEGWGFGCATSDAAQRSYGPVKFGGRHRHLDQVGSNPCLELVGGTGRDHPAPVDDDAVIRELVDFLQVLGGEQ